ncbi:MAG: NADP-dependent oxidoreductase [Acidimicrobiia bacterium]
MKAIVVDDYGAEPELRDIPAPEPGPGEILVRVSSSSLNGFDRASTGGWLKGMIEHEFPFVVGKDFAGTVEAVGEGVTQYEVGDPVFGVVLGPVLHDGAFCEYLTVAENGAVAPIPAGLDPVVAGALGLAASTAVAVVDAVAAEQGETVLIVGATGGVGPLALQMLRDRGVQVIATARPGAWLDLVEEAGADHTVDYSTDITPQVRALRPDGVDAAIHMAGDAGETADLVRRDGRFVSIVGGEYQVADRPISAVGVFASPDREMLTGLAEAVVSGELKLTIRTTYRLEEARAALEEYRQFSVAKVAILVA